MKTCVGVLICLSIVACDSRGIDGPGGQGGASHNEVSSCKSACDQQKFFDCYDASAHAECLASCTLASSAEVDTFTRCVNVEICDAECQFVAAAASTTTGTAPSGVPTTSGCETACRDYIEAGCTEVSDTSLCAAQCASVSEAERAWAVYCIGAATECRLPDDCSFDGGGAEPTESCTDACDGMLFLSCLSAEEHAACRTRCGAASAAESDTFIACAKRPCTDSACYTVFDPTGGPGPTPAACPDVSGTAVARFTPEGGGFDCPFEFGVTLIQTDCELTLAGTVNATVSLNDRGQGSGEGTINLDEGGSEAATVTVSLGDGCQSVTIVTTGGEGPLTCTYQDTLSCI